MEHNSGGPDIPKVRKNISSAMKFSPYDVSLQEIIRIKTPTLTNMPSFKANDALNSSHSCPKFIAEKINYALRTGLSCFSLMLLSTLKTFQFVNFFGLLTALTVIDTSLGGTFVACGDFIATGIYGIPLALLIAYLSQYVYLIRVPGLFLANFWVCWKKGLSPLMRKFTFCAVIVGIIQTPKGAKDPWSATITQIYLNYLVGVLFGMAAMLLPFPNLALFQADHRIDLLIRTSRVYFLALQRSYSEGTEVHHAHLRTLSDTMKTNIEELQTRLRPTKWECVLLPFFHLDDHLELATFVDFMNQLWQRAEGMRLGSKHIVLTNTHLAFVEHLEINYKSVITEIISSLERVADQLRFRKVLHFYKTIWHQNQNVSMHTEENPRPVLSVDHEECPKNGRLRRFQSKCKSLLKCSQFRNRRNKVFPVLNIQLLLNSWEELFFQYKKARHKLHYGVDLSSWDGKDSSYCGEKVEVQNFVQKDVMDGLFCMFSRNLYMFEVGNIVRLLKDFHNRKDPPKRTLWLCEIWKSTAPYFSPPTLTDMRSFFANTSELKFPLKVASCMAVMSLPASSPGAMWGPLTIAFIASKHTSSSFTTCTTRLLGTALGAVFAQFLIQLHGPTNGLLKSGFITLWITVMAVGRLSKTYGYAGYVASFTPSLLLMGTLGLDGVMVRINKTVIGVFLYTVVDNLLWPVSARPLLTQSVSNMLTATATCLDGLEELFSHSGSEESHPLVNHTFPEAHKNPELLAQALLKHIHEAKGLLVLAANEPDIWRLPFDSKGYSKVINAEEKVHKYLELLMRACKEFPADENTFLVTFQQRVLESITKMVRDVKFALKQSNEIILTIKDSSLRLQPRPLFGGDLEPNRASGLLLLKDLVEGLEVVYENEIVNLLQNLHNPVLSEKLSLSYNSLIFGLIQVQRSFLVLGHAIWALIEKAHYQHFQ